MVFKCKKCKQIFNTNYYYVTTYGENGICQKCISTEKQLLKTINLYSYEILELSSILDNTSVFLVELGDGYDKNYKFRARADNKYEVRYRIWDNVADKFPEIDISSLRIVNIEKI